VRRRGARSTLVLVAALALALALSGCVKLRLTIDVKASGSGTLVVALGIDQQALTDLGADADQFAEEVRAQAEAESGEDFTVRQWTDGEYQWVEVEEEFGSLAELSSGLLEEGLFESLSLSKHEDGFLTSRFVLDGWIAPLSLPEGMSAEVPLDVEVLEYVVAVRLPGTVVETNGSEDGSGALVWLADDLESVHLHAVSRSLDWAGVGLLGAVVLVGGGFILIGVKSASRSRADATAPSAASALPAVPAVASQPVGKAGGAAAASVSAGPGLGAANALVTSRARELVDEVNWHVLQGAATVSQTADEVAMVWAAGPDGTETRAVRVRVVDGETVSVNGLDVPSTPEGVKRGVVGALRRLQGLP